jgi:nucleotidyltransferase substrate binding protein (TIGR01987 family)
MKAKEGSDIDIAYEVESEDYEDRLALEAALQEIETLTKIDVVNISTADKVFVDRVLSYGKIIYTADELELVQQAIETYRRAFYTFERVVQKEEQFKEDGYYEYFLDVLIKRFEFTYEMSWKSIKRLLAFEGVKAKTPRSVFVEAFAIGLIKDQDSWVELMKTRNTTAHIYDQWQVELVKSEVIQTVALHKSLLEAIDRRIDKYSHD